MRHNHIIASDPQRTAPTYPPRRETDTIALRHGPRTVRLHLRSDTDGVQLTGESIRPARLAICTPQGRYVPLETNWVRILGLSQLPADHPLGAIAIAEHTRNLGILQIQGRQWAVIS